MTEKTFKEDASPWNPIKKPIDLKHLGKFIEELSKCASAAARCIIQGIDEVEPSTLKPNRQWLMEEVADVLANAVLVVEHFSLDQATMDARIDKKLKHLRSWHAMLGDDQ